MKKVSIKEAFIAWDAEQMHPKLPEGHEERFSKRLSTQKQFHKRRAVLQWAAVALLCIGLSQTFWFTQETPSEEVLKFQKAETHFTFLINQQLKDLSHFDSPQGKQFMEDSKLLINRIQEDYQRLYSQWQLEPNQSKLIQALISNLKTQIDLLTELQNQLITIKNLENENKIL